MGGGALVGLESMISTVLSGSSVDGNANTSVRSRRRSSPGNLSLSALKWFDMGLLGGCDGGTGGQRSRNEQGGVDVVGVGPGDGVRAALDHHQLHVVDQAGQPLTSRGRPWSASPWMTSTGTSIFSRSARKSVARPGRSANSRGSAPPAGRPRGLHSGSRYRPSSPPDGDFGHEHSFLPRSGLRPGHRPGGPADSSCCYCSQVRIPARPSRPSKPLVGRSTTLTGRVTRASDHAPNLTAGPSRRL